MRRRVHLHGTFKSFHDGPIEIDSENVWDAVEAVTTQLKGFQPTLAEGRKVIQVAGYDTIEKMKAPSQDEDIHVFPSMVFSKNGGVVQTIIGAALLVVGFLTANPYLIMMGTSLMIGGVVQMLSPQPQLTGNERDVRSKYLGPAQNTVQIGTPIPILYGRRRVGGHILSMNIDAQAANA
jgi:predicted phage tail protein